MAEIKELKGRDLGPIYSKLVERAADGLWLLDKNLLTIYVNPALEALLGYSREEMLGRSWYDFGDPGWVARAKELEMLRQSGVKRPHEFLFLHKDGHKVLARIASTPLYDKGGGFDGAIGVLSDITGQDAAQARREGEEKYRHLVDNFHDIVYTLAPDGVFAFVSPAWTTLLGHPVSQVTGQSFRQFIHPDDLPGCMLFLQKVMETGQRQSGVEYRVRHLNGAWRWHRTSAVPLKDEAGAVAGFQGIASDITGRKQAEDKLAESEANFRTFFESLTDMIFVGAPDGRVLFTNSAVTRTLGYTPDELKGMDMLAVHPADKRREAEETFTAMFKGERDSCPLPLAAKSGALIPVETRVWFGRWNGANCIFGISKNITAQQEAQQRFERLFRNNPALMALSSLPGRQFIDVNNSFLKAIGYTREEVLGKTTAELGFFLHPEQQVAVANRLQADGRITSYELQVKCKDGTILDGLFSGDVIESQGRRHFLTVMVDITERNRLNNELSKSEAELSALLENLPAGVVIVDPVTKIIEKVNKHVSSLFGAPAEQLVGRRCHSLLCPASEGACPICDLGQTVDNADRIMMRADGGRLPILKTAKLVNINGQNKALECFVDISERKRAEENLQQLSVRISLAARAGKVGVWDYDLVGNALVWDAQMFALYGITQEEFSGAYEAWVAGMHPEDRARGDLEIQQAISGKKEFDTEFRVVWPDGSIHNIRALATVQRDAGGKALRMVGTNWDITTQKQSEAALMDATRRANSMAAKAEAANVSKSQFLANMSHEIRTPMNGVIGMTGLLLDTALDAEQRRYAEIVRASGESLLALINDILDFSKIEAKKLDLETLDFNLTWLLDDFAATQSMRAQAKGLELLCVPGPEVPVLLRGDPGRLRQILTNLVGNAIKFTATGKVSVSAAVAEENTDNVLLRFSVRDTGAGIPKDKLGLLFNKFTQVDASVTRQYGGTGLGLAISKQLAELMGGAVGVGSEEGKGSEFWFTVRLGKQAASARAGEEKAPIATRHTAREIANRFAGRKARILLAEDNITNQQVALGILKKMGLRADAVANGAEALKALETLPYDLVLMDVQMPELDGIEATRIIRANQFAGINHLIPVIAMTAHAMKGDRERCIAAGMNDYVAKPVSPQELAAALAKWLPNEPSGAPGRTPAEAEEAAFIFPDKADSLVFDKAGVMERLMDDEALAREVSGVFLADTPKRISALRDCLDAGDAKGAELHAHSIKGSSANVGGEILRAAAFALEQDAKAGNLAAGKARLITLESHFADLQQAIKKEW